MKEESSLELKREWNFKELNDLSPEERLQFEKDMMERTEGEISLKYPVVIITCGNRKRSILKDIDQFKHSKVYVYIYETEKELYDWLEGDYITKVYVPEEYRSCQKMRVYVQQTIDADIFHFLDDDLRQFWFYRRKQYISAVRGLKIAEYVIQDYDWGVIGYGMFDTSCHFRGTNDVRVHLSNSFIILNNKLCKDNGCYYTGDTTVAEDEELIYYLALKGIRSYEFMFLSRFEYYACGGRDSIASNMYRYLDYTMNSIIMLSDKYKPLKISKRGKLLGCININKILNGVKQEWDPDILEACKNKDLKQLYKVLISKGCCHWRWKEQDFPYDMVDDTEFLEACYYNGVDPIEYYNNKVKEFNSD